MIAGLRSEFEVALNYTLSIDFTAPDGLVNPFETIIRYINNEGLKLTRRYVGGLVSTVDLLEYFLDKVDVEQNLVDGLRRQAEVLVRKLAPGFPSLCPTPL